MSPDLRDRLTRLQDGTRLKGTFRPEKIGFAITFLDPNGRQRYSSVHTVPVPSRKKP